MLPTQRKTHMGTLFALLFGRAFDKMGKKANICPKLTKNAYFGPILAVFGPKILIFMGVSKSFGTKTPKPRKGLFYLISCIINVVELIFVYISTLFHCFGLMNPEVKARVVYIAFESSCKVEPSESSKPILPHFFLCSVSCYYRLLFL